MNRWLAAGAIGITGMAALVTCFRRVDPYVQEPATIGRREALQRAMQLSSRYGVETAGWRVAIAAETSDRLRAYRKSYPDDPVARAFTAFNWDIGLRAPARGSAVRVVLAADGAPREWERKDAPGALAPSVPWAGADAVLHDFAGDADAKFVGQVTDGGGETRSWEWRAGGRFPLVSILDITQKDGRLVSVKRRTRYDERFYQPLPEVAGQAATGMLSGLAVLTVVIAALLVFFRSGKKTLTSRVAPIVAAPVVAWSAWQGFGGQEYQRIAYQQLMGIGGGNGMIGLAIGLVIPIFGIFLFTGAAYSIRSSSNRAKWLSLESLVGGGLATRPVGTALAAGLVAAAGIAAIPYVAGMLSRNGMPFHDSNPMSASLPQVEALDPSPAILQMAVFGFLWPLLARLRSPAMRYSLFALGGILIAGNIRPILFENFALNLLAGCLTFLVCFFLYLRFDLLAPMASVCAAHAIHLGSVFVVQPERSLHAAGLQVFAALGISAVVAAVVARRGRELAPSADWEDPEPVPLVASDRARLDAEFQVARRAQEAALPPVPPSLGAYGFAASCQPAQQVGGDLFDFFPLPGGRLGVVVADVSGKGVPAALYMMVTKGLLSAGARDSGDLRYLLGEVNLHLYRTCKRKVFVTMAAVSLDPAGSRCLYGRAGHNPMIWRRTRRGETVVLKTRGLGLGMVAAESFGRTLEIQELQLEPEDALVLYSDGITEAVNATMEQFGEERLLRAVNATDGQSAEAARATIARDLAQFVGTTPPRDDITLVFVRVGAGAPVGDAERELV